MNRVPGRPGRLTGCLRRAARALLGIACLALLLPAVGRAEVVFALSNNPGNLPIYVAESAGLFAVEGVQVRVLPCDFGKVCLRLLLDGKAQMCAAADLPIALAGFGREPFAVVATLSTNRNDTKIVARRASGIRKPADLLGRSVGVVGETSAHYALESLLYLENIDPAKVRITLQPPRDSMAALAAGSLDAAALFEPWADETVRQLGAEAVVLETHRIYTQTWNLVAAPAPRGPSPTELAGVMRALEAAARLIEREPARAKAVLHARTKLSPAWIDAHWASFDYTLGLGQALVATLEGDARWARRHGIVSGPIPNYLGFIQTEPLRLTQPARVTLVK